MIGYFSITMQSFMEVKVCLEWKEQKAAILGKQWELSELPIYQITSHWYMKPDKTQRIMLKATYH